LDIPSEVFDKLAENGIEKHDVRKRPYDPKRAKAQNGDAGTAGRAYTSADNRNNAGGKNGHMQFIEDLREGDSIHSIYLCKKKQELKTKAGKSYDSLTLQDKTGTLDAKIWNPGDMGIGDFDNLDYVDVTGDLTSFQGSLQLNVRRIRRCGEGEYDPADYLPVSERSIDEMWTEFSNYIGKIEEPHMKALLESFFVDDPDFIQTFKNSSAAKTMHHGYVGGLLEHSLNVTKLCYAYCRLYPTLKRDLLVPAAMLHDIGKTRELSPFPRNDYTDEGQLLGHIVIGCMMIDEKIKGIDGFPVVLKEELEHCILAHHGKLEFGSPKVPALMEAAALNFADNTDAHLEMFKEILAGSNLDAWAGYQSKVESNVRRTDLE
jgi:3'-5' exoribonuclease